jgi:hypothetical protein
VSHAGAATTAIGVKWHANAGWRVQPHGRNVWQRNALLQVMDADALTPMGVISLPPSLQSAVPCCLEVADGLVFFEPHRNIQVVYVGQDEGSTGDEVLSTWVLHRDDASDDSRGGLVLEQGRGILSRYIRAPWKWASTGRHIYAMQPSDLGSIFYIRSVHDVLLRDGSAVAAAPSAAAAAAVSTTWAESKREGKAEEPEDADAEGWDMLRHDAATAAAAPGGNHTNHRGMLTPIRWTSELTLDPAVEYAMRAEASDCRGARTQTITPIAQHHVVTCTPAMTASSFPSHQHWVPARASVAGTTVTPRSSSLTQWVVTRTEQGLRSHAGWNCTFHYNGFAAEAPIAASDARLRLLVDVLCSERFPPELATMVSAYVFVLQ